MSKRFIRLKLEMAFPRCKRCNAKDIPTYEWFNPGHVYHCKHLCEPCFDKSTEEVLVLIKEN